MELWIRSQDRKSIVKPTGILLENPLNSGETGIRGYFSNHSFKMLGYYKTEQRALEVLDEIQDILKPKYILDTSSIKPDGDFYEENGVIFQKYNANARIEELSTFVYQMPKE